MNFRQAYRRSSRKYHLLLCAACIAAIYLRIVALGSDAFPGLSWSSALLTDEGFYIHNARNLVLFGTARTDQFNNMLIMPVLNAIQVLVFRLWGVGVLQARMITVVASLISLPLFYLAVGRALGRRTAVTATLFLALDHVYFLYNRLALMDSPAASLLIVAFYLWILGLSNSGLRRTSLLFASGISLVAAYCVRGLVAPLLIAPLLAMWRRPESNRVGIDGYGTTSRLWSLLREASPIAAGVLTGSAVYLIAWYMPNRSEIVRVNHYYLQQLMPSGLSESCFNMIGAAFGNSRGMAAFLMRHSTAAFLLTVAWICAGSEKHHTRTGLAASPSTNVPLVAEEFAVDEETVGTSNIGHRTLRFATAWVIILWAIFAITDYSPSRYYVISYPAMAIIGSHALWHMSGLARAILRRPVGAALLLVLTIYHAALVVAERCFSPEVGFRRILSIIGRIVSIDISAPVIIATLAGLVTLLAASLLLRAAASREARIQSKIPGLIGAAIAVWMVGNVGWTCSWLGHLTYRQRDADRWLGDHLPVNSVLFGAVAPGLCLNNHFRAISVIQGLCNDQDPLFIYPNAPHYVLMLDDDWRETWWDVKYPGLLSAPVRIKTFRHILRPRFTVGVYKVNEKNQGGLQ